LIAAVCDAYTGEDSPAGTIAILRRAPLMKTRSMILRLVAIASAIALIGCDNTVAISPEYINVVISPRPASVPVGSTMVFTGTVSNNLSLPQWSVLDSAYAGNVGTLTPIAGSTTTILYTAPPAPPIYTNTPTGITQGTITLNASTTSPPGTSIPIVGDSVSFVITAPSVTVGLSPGTASVALNATQQFFGYAVGNSNNTLTWQVNGVTGGSTSVGTINSAGTYVAPANLPMSGNPVTVTIISQADPTKTASATVTLH
jgi:hypothetical protein